MTENTHAGRLIVLTGPTAVGKGTVEAKLRAGHPEVWVSVSATTRDPRPGEVNGVNYWFLSEDEFLAKEQRGVLGNRSGAWNGPLRHVVKARRRASGCWYTHDSGDRFAGCPPRQAARL